MHFYRKIMLIYVFACMCGLTWMSRINSCIPEISRTFINDGIIELACAVLEMWYGMSNFVFCKRYKLIIEPSNTFLSQERIILSLERLF